jgi:thiol-disulfide isomerase/thioredoxin
MKIGRTSHLSARLPRPAARLLLVLATLALAACSRNASETKGSEALWSSTAFGLDDQPVAMLKYGGKPLVVNFWARWCPPCRDEIPDFIAVRRQFQAQGVELVGIGIENEAPAVGAFVRDYRIDYPVLLAREQGLPLMAALGNPSGALPFTVAIDRQGYVVARKVGRMSHSEMEAAFSAALR